MKKRWTMWTLFFAGVLLASGLMFYGCGKQEVTEQAAPAAPLAEAPSASAPEQSEQGTTPVTPGEEPARPAAAQEPAKSGEM